MLLTLSMPVIIEAPFILDLWLKEVPEYTVIFLQIAIFTAMLNTLSNHIILTMNAKGKVRDYQIVVGGLSLLTLPLVYTTLKFGAEPYHAMIIAFVVEFVCHLARLYMLNRMISFPIIGYLRNVTFRVYAITLLAMIIPVIVYNSIESEIPRFLLVSIISLISTLSIGYMLGFNKEERAMIKEKVIRIIRKKILKR